MPDDPAQAPPDDSEMDAEAESNPSPVPALAAAASVPAASAASSSSALISVYYKTVQHCEKPANLIQVCFAFEIGACSGT